VGEELLKVHREYLTLLSPHLGDKRIHGLAHITGGGLFDNVLRVLPEGCQAHIEKSSWEPLPIFELLRSIGDLSVGDLSDEEAYRALNMGIGMVLAVDSGAADELAGKLDSGVSDVVVIGEIQAGDAAVFLS
jgi:phosphoribosylformylglycinamidine cyclo-ligase